MTSTGLLFVEGEDHKKQVRNRTPFCDVLMDWLIATSQRRVMVRGRE